jgi:hypothetical protein
MAGKANFTPDEWARVVASPMVAGMAVTAADPSGLWGLLQEAFAGGRWLLEAAQRAGAGELAKAVADDIATSETQKAVRERVQAQFQGAPAGGIKDRAIEELRSVAALVDAKAPGDAGGFKIWLHEGAQRVAEAAKEGGFMGFGGVAVSDAEKATLAEISAALGQNAGARA